MAIRTHTPWLAVLTLLSAAVSNAAGVSTKQADSTAGQAKSDDVELEEIVVTGSALPTSPNAVSIPVIALDASKLEQNGVSSNALEILRKAIPSFAGRSNAGNSNANNNNQNTAGGSQVQLRNLPTLVLINGRRVANSAVGGLNGKNFVDVNQIPAAAIDRIEVLTDGASSIYGSDAIGGVVNFILKKNYEGLTSGVRYAHANDYSERSIYVTGGTKLGGVSITATGSFSKTDPLYQNTRSFTSPLYGKTSSVPGVVSGGNALLAPNLNSPRQTNPVGTAATATTVAQLIANGTYNATTPTGISSGFDVSQFQTLLLQQEQDSFVTSLSSKFMDDRLEAFGDFMISRTKSFTQWLPVPVTGISVPQNAPYNPLAGNFTGVIFDDLDKPKQVFNTSLATRLTAGLRGDLAGTWKWEAGLTWSSSSLEQKQENLIYKPNVAPAIAGGFDASGNAVTGGAYAKVLGGYSLTGATMLQPALDPFARAAGLNPAALNNVYGTEVLNAHSTLTSLDTKVVGTLFALPAGAVDMAVGGSIRREKLDGRADANGRVTDPVTGSTSGNDQQWLGGTFVDPFSVHRDIDAIFVETRVPITSDDWHAPGFNAFDITGALRWERYSDAGNSTVPKIGFRWQPFDRQLTLRGNYSKSYSAPSLYAEYGPTDTRQVGTGVLAGLFGSGFAQPFNGEDGNNPNLKPATSISHSFGFVFKPDFLNGLNVSADYSNITLHGYAGGLGFNNIIGSVNNLGAASPYFSNLAIGNFAGAPGATQPFTNPGDLKNYLTNGGVAADPTRAANLYVIDQFRNLATLIEHSYNFNVDYVLHTDAFGVFDVSTTGAFFTSFKFQDLPTNNFIEYAGHSNNTGVFGGTLPKYRFFTSFDWNFHNWDLTLSNTYVASTTDTGANGVSTPEIPVASYTTWDMRVAYDWVMDGKNGSKDLKFALGVNNLSNRMPPLAPRAFLDNNADVSTFSPIGRLIYATASVKF